MLEELTKLVHDKFPDCHLALYYKKGWCIREINGKIVEYGNGFDKLYDTLQKDYTDNTELERFADWEVQTPFFSYEEVKDNLHWMELLQDSSYDA